VKLVTRAEAEFQGFQRPVFAANERKFTAQYRQSEHKSLFFSGIAIKRGFEGTFPIDKLTKLIIILV